MSVFHRVDDPFVTLPAPLFFQRALRLGAYEGVMRARLMELENGEGGHHAAPRDQPRRVSDDVAIAQLAAEGWIEHKKE